MSTQSVGIILWLVLMLLAIPYVQRAKHPRAKPLAAYMVFVTLFSVGAAVIFSVLLMLLSGYGGLDALRHVPGAALFLVLVFVPAFLLGRWQMKKPPRQVPVE